MARSVPQQLTTAPLPRSVIERIRSSIHPAQEKIRARDFLPKARAFLNRAGLTWVTALIVDDEDLFPPKGKEGGPLASAVEVGLAYLEKRGPVSQVILVVEGRPKGYHVILGMSFMRRHPKSQPGLLVNVSALPTTTPVVRKPPKGVRGLDWLLQETKRRAEKTRTDRQAFVDEYSKQLSESFPTLRVKVTKRV